MKRLLCIVASLFVSLNLAYANDLLFKASNGALNQNSVGVKKLNDEELKGVVGGYAAQNRMAPFLSQWRLLACKTRGYVGRKIYDLGHF